jgi:hypothetical protein
VEWIALQLFRELARSQFVGKLILEIICDKRDRVIEF